ncbi:hypothetical protein ACHAXA_002140 [Cyclostephanos tholiformis]|uniref:Class II aldolase/adducin N-terminal domain-containing protein n=1 Tax=Cyclostephanos tholiformis TaxID=382380 RepID=A0ABD3RTH5_9STRA
MSDQQQDTITAPTIVNTKQRTTIAIPSSGGGHPSSSSVANNVGDDVTRRPIMSSSRRPSRRQSSMLPRQQSMRAFDPDNYSSDEDDVYLHEENGASVLPGAGWTNGDIPPQFAPAVTLHPYTRSGRLALYGHHRRMINFASSWSRIGDDSTEMDAVHDKSSGGTSVMSGCPLEEGRAVRALVAQLCERFYDVGWATGTGGGVSIRVGGGDSGRPYRVFVAPSGVMKEDMVGDDVFELDMDMNVVRPPRTPKLRLSACTPLWYTVYRNRPNAMCVIHTHSIYAQLATLLDPTERSVCLALTHLEMLKGVGNHSYDDVLEVPIIDNRPTEDLLADQLEVALSNYPRCNAVLVRRHGVYVWGDSWEQAKAQCESFDYLFESAVKMRGMGIDIGIKPSSGTYHVDKKGKGKEEEEEKKEKKDEEPPAKRHKSTTDVITPDALPAFNASGSCDNASDLVCAGTSIPLAPRDAKILLLDIEGTTTSISFVKDVLFPYVLENLDNHIDEMDDGGISDLLLGAAGVVKLLVKALMAHDVKATGLKSFQGKLWKAGYASGELVGHLYSDFEPMMKWCHAMDVKVCIYSSGSIAAQKLLFGHTSVGDMTSYIGGYFDTTSGSKRETDSYVNIAEALGVATKDVIFVSDLEAEIRAADQAGMRSVVAVRPGNAPLSIDTREKFPLLCFVLCFRPTTTTTTMASAGPIRREHSPGGGF